MRILNSQPRSLMAQNRKAYLSRGRAMMTQPIIQERGKRSEKRERISVLSS